MQLPTRHRVLRAVLAWLIGLIALVGGGAVAHAFVSARPASAATEAAPPPSRTAFAARPTPVPVPTPTYTTHPAPAVAPLGARIVPDVLVQSAQTLSPAQVHAALYAITATHALQLDSGQIHLGSGVTEALGVDPSTFRAWTPAGTADSDPLWQSVARGDVAVAHAVAAALAVPLGGVTTAGATTPVPERVGALATTGIPGVGLIIDQLDEAPLGLVPGSALLVTATPGSDPVVTAAEIQSALGKAATVTPLRVPVTDGHLQWVAPAYGPITSPFGWRNNPNDPGHPEFHGGIDIGAPLGAPIYAAAAGVVQYAGPASGFGQEIILTNADGVSTVYGHMEKILVTSGPVKVGQPIALVGAEGDATGPHLHFEVHVGGTRVDPAAWLVAHGVKITR
ncbi:MAG TPA: M23 family metallopeptidase [Mycobacteriales bacterium]